MPHIGGQPHIGLAGTEAALLTGLTAGFSGLEKGVGFAQEQLDPFIQPGQQAGQQQAAFSGALGPAAQAQAFQNFQTSPGQQFLQERGQQNLLRNQAAIGGLGGGNVRQELVRQGIGFAQGDLQRQLQQLGSVANRGFSGAQQLGGIGAQAGAQAGQFGIGVTRDIASARTRAGEQIAGNLAQTTSALSNLISQEGRGLTDIIGQGGGNLANILGQAGRETALSQEQLAIILANIATQSGTGQQPSIANLIDTGGSLQDIAAIVSGVGGGISPSDKRLKTNIVKIGKTKGGNNIYRWDWIDKRMTNRTVGVIAQELIKTQPEAVSSSNGYLMVDYSKVA